jgi:hypothetical protein
MTISINKIAVVLFSVFLLVIPVFVEASILGGTIEISNAGPMFAGRMLHAWTSLIAAIIIFFLALKYMTGGKLAYPIMLIGLGALSDAVFGLMTSPANNIEFAWLGNLIFSVAVVFAVIWMGYLFGGFTR